MNMDENQEILDEFIQESRESLQSAEPLFLAIESAIKDGEPGDPEKIDEIFRLFHSMKGVAGYLQFDEITQLTHVAESLLDLFRAGKATPTVKHIDLLLACVDTLTATLGTIEKTGSDIGNAKDIRIYVEELKTALAEAKKQGQPADGSANKTGKAEGVAEPTRRVNSIRVETDKLDTLMNLVGELIIAETAIAHNPGLQGRDFEDFHKSLLHLRRITRSLQDIAMSVRMVPISKTFQRMRRLVRDLAQTLSKDVDLVLDGEATEVDKTVIENIADPLVHIIRNSLDHGLETPGEREAAGKTSKARITLSAHQQGGEVLIRVVDNGRGLNRDRILERALERGLWQEGREISDREVYEMIFEPAFSTAEKVTDISGRGVGMDVVRRNIESLSGRVEVDSVPGKGTTITIRIPLMLAIIEGMLVRVGQTLYTIPLLAIRESVRATSKDITRLANGTEVVGLRGELVVVLRLHEMHGIKPDYQRLEEGILIVVEDNDETVCLFADEIIGQQQTVIKSLGEYLGAINGLSGCSVLGSGDISLILDVGGLVRSSRHAA